MQALILAAGRGSRLGNKSAEIPKCLLEVGRRPIIEHQLKTLAEAGVGPVAMVLGYCADEIREIVGIRAEYVINSRWSSTNSLYSFWLAREWVNGPVVVVNCDILFHPDILGRLLAAKGDASAFDSGSGDGREHMKVAVVNGRLISMSKQLPRNQVAGENVGILSFTQETARALFRKAGQLIDDGGEKQWLGSAVCEIVKEREVLAVDVAGLPWGEIDFPYDLDRVRKEVWPVIQRDSRARRRWWRLARGAAALALVLLLLMTGFQRWLSPGELTWEPLEVENVATTRIRAGDRWQTWSLIQADETAEMQVFGPVPVRIDSRILVAKGISTEVPYVVEVELDDWRVGWFKETGKPSRQWRHADFGIAKRQRINLDVPEGLHTLRVRLVASDTGVCLLRVRQKVFDDPEE